MEIKEILADRIIRERLQSVLEKIKEENRENFAEELEIKVDAETCCDGIIIYLDKIKEKKEKIFKIIPSKSIDRKTLIWIILKKEEIFCGVNEPILYPAAKEKISKAFEAMKGETYINKIVFKKDF